MTSTFAILLASKAIGGAERYLVELAIAMRRTTTRPVILNLKEPMPYHADLQRHDVEVRSGIASNRLDPAGVLRLTRAIRDVRPDVLLINSNRQAMILGALASRLCRVPVTLVHTHDHIGPNFPALRCLARITDGIVAAAEDHRAFLCSVHGLPPSRVTWVYPGINLDRTRSDDTRQRPKAGAARGATVGIVAALRPEKDHETFLRAAAIVVQRAPETRFVIIGDGARRPQLEELARQLRLGARVQFLGWRNVDATQLRALDVLALSSLHETFPAVMLEAFSAGVPVVTTDVGSIRELLGTPPCAVLVPPRNPAALAEGLTAVLHDPLLATTMASAALRRVEYFRADRFCRDMLSLAERIGNAKARGRVRDISQVLAQSAGSAPSGWDHAG